MKNAKAFLITCLLGWLALLGGPAAAQQARKLDPDTAFKGYLAAWAETDATKRLQLLEKVFAADGSHTDPREHIQGREAFSEHIGKVMRQIPSGTRVVQASQIDAHHDVMRVDWKMVRGGGAVFMEGVDFCEFDEQGRFRRIVGFTGPLAAIK